MAQPEDVDQWYGFLAAEGVVVKNPPRTHRDGARSFYCEDPDGNGVQMIYHPPLSKGKLQNKV
jgi:catechol 2,3-dioxygenase-like lactoylglutathione lyase family enzyme